jgi:hypothetical protein
MESLIDYKSKRKSTAKVETWDRLHRGLPARSPNRPRPPGQFGLARAKAHNQPPRPIVPTRAGPNPRRAPRESLFDYEPKRKSTAKVETWDRLHHGLPARSPNRPRPPAPARTRFTAAPFTRPAPAVTRSPSKTYTRFAAAVPRPAAVTRPAPAVTHSPAKTYNRFAAAVTRPAAAVTRSPSKTYTRFAAAVTRPAPDVTRPAPAVTRPAPAVTRPAPAVTRSPSVTRPAAAPNTRPARAATAVSVESRMAAVVQMVQAQADLQAADFVKRLVELASPTGQGRLLVPAQLSAQLSARMLWGQGFFRYHAPLVSPMPIRLGCGSANACHVLYARPAPHASVFVKFGLPKANDPIYRDALNSRLLQCLAAAETPSFRRHLMTFYSAFAWPKSAFGKGLLQGSVFDLYAPPVPPVVDVYTAAAIRGISLYDWMVERPRRAAIAHDAFSPGFYKALVDLFLFLAKAWGVHGFSHNDLHDVNVMYDVEEQCLRIIDYGMSSFDTAKVAVAVRRHRTALVNTLYLAGLPAGSDGPDPLLILEQRKQHAPAPWLNDIAQLSMRVRHEQNKYSNAWSAQNIYKAFRALGADALLDWKTRAASDMVLKCPVALRPGLVWFLVYVGACARAYPDDTETERVNSFYYMWDRNAEDVCEEIKKSVPDLSEFLAYANKCWGARATSPAQGGASIARRVATMSDRDVEDAYARRAARVAYLTTRNARRIR